jgi:hypothetical protein
MNAGLAGEVDSAHVFAGVVRYRQYELGAAGRRLAHAIGEEGAIRRVRCCRIAPGRLNLAERVEHIRIPQREQPRFLAERLRRHIAERGVVVEDERAASERSDDEILFAPLNHEITRLRGGNAASELHPVRAAVRGEVHAELQAREEKVRVHVVLCDRPGA